MGRVKDGNYRAYDGMVSHYRDFRDAFEQGDPPEKEAVETKSQKQDRNKKESMK